MALETRALFYVSRMDALVHNESTKGRIKFDTQDEDRLHDILVSFNMLSKREHVYKGYKILQ